MSDRELYEQLREIALARDATNLILRTALQSIAERLLAELRMQELDDKQHLNRLRAAIGIAIMGLSAIVEGLQFDREQITTGSCSNEN